MKEGNEMRKEKKCNEEGKGGENGENRKKKMMIMK
jgi:hypothetical protein